MSKKYYVALYLIIMRVMISIHVAPVKLYSMWLLMLLMETIPMAKPK